MLQQVTTNRFDIHDKLESPSKEIKSLDKEIQNMEKEHKEFLELKIQNLK